MTGLRRALWWLVGGCAVHVAEEYALGWTSWVRELSGVSVSPGLFVAANAAFLLLACAAAFVGPRRPAVALALPSLALINGLFFHVAPTLVLGRVSPGVFSSALLYVPISTWLFWRARREGLLTPGVAVRAVALGAVVMAVPLVVFRLS